LRKIGGFLFASYIGKVSLPIDILVCDVADFNIRKNNQSTFEYIISTEGQKIYG
jgi:hypothetical protein